MWNKQKWFSKFKTQMKNYLNKINKILKISLIRTTNKAIIIIKVVQIIKRVFQQKEPKIIIM